MGYKSIVVFLDFAVSKIPGGIGAKSNLGKNMVGGIVISPYKQTF
jgi:hypothetical protein